MSSTKDQLTKLMSLDNPQADEYLSGFASRIQTTIETSLSNDDILDQLELLESFVYKVPSIAIQVIDYVLSHPFPAVSKDTVLGAFEGKRHSDLILKSLDLLEHIRYIEPDKVLERLATCIAYEDENLANKAKSVLQRFAKFDLNLLMRSSIGYGPQKKALEFISRWPEAEQLENFDFIEVVLRELLGSSVEGSEMENPDSVTLRFGAIRPTDFLKQLRSETMDLIYRLYVAASESHQRLRLVKTLKHAASTPHMGPYGDDLAQMIADDTKVMIEIYGRMLFDDSGHLVGDIGVAHEIETTLAFYEDKVLGTEARELRSKILSDGFYGLFRLLIGTDRFYRREGTWDDAEANRRTEIDHRIDTIEASNLSDWIRDLNAIASHAQMLNGWEFRHFDYFLRSFATINPSIAKTLLDDALQSKKPVSVFAADFLDGFREGGEIALWDEVVGQIARKGDPIHVSAIVWSLNLNRSVNLEQGIREKDLNLIKDIVYQRNDFTFLSNRIEPDRLLRQALITALVRLFRRDPTLVERLILKELEDHSDLKNSQLSAIHLGLLTGWIDFGQFSTLGIKFLKNWLIGFSDLSWDAQELLLNIGRNDLQIVLDVFLGRIEENERREDPILGPERYEAVPFNFNPDLANFLSGHPNLRTAISGWIENMTPERFHYNWSLNRFLNEIGAVHEVQSALIEDGDDASLEKALALADPSNGGDPHLMIEIVRRTENEKIIDRVGASFYSTGVVWGEYGIAGAYEARKEMLSQYLEDPSERVRSFAERMIDSFEKSIGEERVRVAERKEIRRIEFEG